MKLLFWFEKIRTPFFDSIFSGITHLGDEIALMLIAIVLFWCINKRSGYYMLVSGFLGIIVNQVLKLACKIPRPEKINTKLSIVESARAGATGYSFPSGHTQNAVTVFGSIFLITKKIWVKIVAVVIAILVGVSRMYLGVHTIWDVIAAAGCAIIILLILEELFKNDEIFNKAMPYIVGVLALAAVGFYLYAMVFTKKSFDVNVISAKKNACKILGCAIAMLVVYPLDRFVIKFETKSTWYGNVIKIAGGFALLMLVRSLKAPFTSLLGVYYEGLVRYFLILVVGGAAWPFLFRYINMIKIGALDKLGANVKGIFVKTEEPEPEIPQPEKKLNFKDNNKIAKRKNTKKK
ncbi:MAG: phosphatase PAP2 family protein [Ruminococcaceae bacterium]|nr:phosphatase PAP2 family protein [Oscillospiraceae bacterium]